MTPRLSSRINAEDVLPVRNASDEDRACAILLKPGSSPQTATEGCGLGEEGGSV